jgi:hypothetical protein
MKKNGTKKKLKKISKELKAASRKHKGQAQRIDKLIKKPTRKTGRKK